MVIALDIDDTISRHPPFFAALSRAMIDAGHTVLIITLRQDRASAEADLLAWQVVFNELICAEMRQLMDLGDKWKASVCRKHGVTVLFEDSPRSSSMWTRRRSA